MHTVSFRSLDRTLVEDANTLLSVSNYTKSCTTCTCIINKSGTKEFTANFKKGAGLKALEGLMENGARFCQTHI